MDTSPIVRRNERLSSSVRTLLELLKQADGPVVAASVRSLPPRVWDETIAFARQHGVGPLLQRALRRGGVLSELPERARVSLEEDRRATALDNLRNYGEFRRIAR